MLFTASKWLIFTLSFESWGPVLVTDWSRHIGLDIHHSVAFATRAARRRLFSHWPAAAPSPDPRDQTEDEKVAGAEKGG